MEVYIKSYLQNGKYEKVQRVNDTVYVERVRCDQILEGELIV